MSISSRTTEKRSNCPPFSGDSRWDLSEFTANLGIQDPELMNYFTSNMVKHERHGTDMKGVRVTQSGIYIC